MPPVRPTGRRVFNQQIVNTAPAVHRRAVFQGGEEKPESQRGDGRGEAGRDAQAGGRGEGAEKGAAREGARRGEAGAGRRARGEANGGTGKEAESQRGEGRGAARGETGAETGGENGDREGVNGDSAARTSDNIMRGAAGCRLRAATSKPLLRDNNHRAATSEPPPQSRLRAAASGCGRCGTPRRRCPRAACRGCSAGGGSPYGR